MIKRNIENQTFEPIALWPEYGEIPYWGPIQNKRGAINERFQYLSFKGNCRSTLENIFCEMIKRNIENQTFEPIALWPKNGEIPYWGPIQNQRGAINERFQYLSFKGNCR